MKSVLFVCVMLMVSAVAFAGNQYGPSGQVSYGSWSLGGSSYSSYSQATVGGVIGPFSSGGSFAHAYTSPFSGSTAYGGGAVNGFGVVDYSAGAGTSIDSWDIGGQNYSYSSNQQHNHH